MTIEDLLAAQTVNMPPASITFKQAGRVRDDQPRTLDLFPD
jgi:hypothetical protein